MVVVAQYEDFAILEDVHGQFVFYASGDVEDLGRP